jgi:death-on-curing protein
MPVFIYLGSESGVGQLESALGQPSQSLLGRFLYRTVYDKAAALFRSLIKNHPLVDGNKRLALTSLYVFLLLNGYLFHSSTNESVQFSRRIAGPEDVDLREVSLWIRRHSLNIDSALSHPERLSPKDRQLIARTVPTLQRIRNLLAHLV